MRMNRGSNSIKTSSVMVRLMRLHDANGTFDTDPVLTHLERKTGLGLLAGVRLKDMCLPELCAAGDWKFMCVTSDNASPNSSCIRYLTFEMAVSPNLIVLEFPCLSHSESNAVGGERLPC